MVEILRVSHYAWREADGKVGPKTQVTWKDEKGDVHLSVLEGTLRDREKIERAVKLSWRR